MTVKVTLKNGDVESFDDDADEFWERHDQTLEVHRADGTVKFFTKGYWVAVDGKQQKDDLLDL